MFHSNGSSASLSFSMGMIWDHHIVWNNYGNQVPIGNPYQLLNSTQILTNTSANMPNDMPLTPDQNGQLPTNGPSLEFSVKIGFVIFTEGVLT